MAAGETIALILESGRAHEEDFLEDDIAELSEAVKQLATDSHKYRAKRDRKAQRATFRDVLRYLEVSSRFARVLRLNNRDYIYLFESRCTSLRTITTSCQCK